MQVLAQLERVGAASVRPLIDGAAAELDGLKEGLMSLEMDMVTVLHVSGARGGSSVILLSSGRRPDGGDIDFVIGRGGLDGIALL